MKLAVDTVELRGLALALLADAEVRDALRVALAAEGGRPHATARQFAGRWSVSVRTVHYWIAQGLPVVRVGRVVRLPLVEGDAWVRGLGENPSQPTRSAPR